MARASIYSQDLAEVICSRLEAGEPLAAICRDESMPGLRTVLRWVDTQEGFGDAYRTAQAAAGEHLDAEIQRISETAIDRDTASAARVRIAALQWRASKAAPKKFADRIDMTVDHSFDLAAVLDKGRQRVLEGNAKLGLPNGDEKPL